MPLPVSIVSELDFFDLDLHVARLRSVISVGSETQISEGVKFTCTGHLSLGQMPTLDEVCTPAYSQAFNVWKRNRERAENWPIGYFTFENVALVGSNAAVVDLKHRRFYVGQVIGWSASYADWNMNLFSEFRPVDGGRRFDFSGKAQDIDSAVVLCGPGYSIFGHQLFDYLPRAAFVTANKLDHNRVTIRQALHPWADEMTRALRDTGNDHVVRDGEIINCLEVVLPSFNHFAQVVDAPSLAATMRLLADRLVGSSRIELGKVAVSRAAWTANNRIPNAARWDMYFTSRGFHVLHPQSLSIGNQVAVFRGASHVAGLDGSGLHAALLGRSLQKLTIVAAERVNPLHFAVASLFDDCTISVVDGLSIHSD